MASNNVADSDSISSGMKEANETREKFAKATALGELGFPELVLLSRQDSHKAVGKIRLINILVNRPGWSETTAIQALRHADFDTKDTVISIRRNKAKIEIFETILTKAKPGQWRARPQMPKSWPWSGKIELIAKEFGAPLPEDIEEALESSLEFNPGTGEIIEPETPRRKRTRGDSSESTQEGVKDGTTDNEFSHLFDVSDEEMINTTINDDEVDHFFRQ